MRIGDFSISVWNGGNFRLDGGAMHGVVPKTIWSKLVSCDADNRCEYATKCVLVEASGKRLLIETGNGDKFPERQKEIYGIDHDASIAKTLAAGGIEAESIDFVVLSHLHFDHVGGATKRVASGVVPVFPRARHIVQAREWEAATHPHERNRASYLGENYLPLEAAGLLHRVSGETEILPGIRVLPTPGHTPGHQSVLIDTGADRWIFLGDVVPTHVHVRLPFVMAYDLDVEATLESKRRLWQRAIAESWTVLFGHDKDFDAARIALDKEGQPMVGERFRLSV